MIFTNARAEERTGRHLRGIIAAVIHGILGLPCSDPSDLEVGI